MTFTASQIRLPADVEIRPGQFARFDAIGRFREVLDYLSNGLGRTYRCVAPGQFQRVSY